MDTFTDQQQIAKLFRVAVKITGHDRALALFTERAGQIVDELIDEIAEDAEDQRDTIASVRPGGIQ